MIGSHQLEVPLEFHEDFGRALKAEHDYQASGDETTLNAAITAWMRIINHAGFIMASNQFQLVAFHMAAIMFQSRYRTRGNLDDLNWALKLWQQAVVATPPDSHDRVIYLNNLGNGLRDRYIHTGQLEDLEESIRIHQQAVDDCPLDHADRPAILNNFSNGLSDRYTRNGQLEDLEKAIQALREAVAGTPQDSTDRPMYLNNLGTCLRAYYARSGQLEDLKEAVQMLREAVGATPQDCSERVTYLNNFGNGLYELYVCTSRIENLEEAIQVYQQAMEVVSSYSPIRPSILTNLGVGLRAHYARTGSLEDLEKAVLVLRQAAGAIPPNSSNRASVLTNLGTSLSTRYVRTGQLEDLQEAVHILLQAVRATPEQSPDCPSRLGNLGLSLRDYYAYSNQLRYLEAAIRVFKQAITATLPQSRDWPSHLNNLGTSLHARYARTRDLEDLEEAIRIFEQAVKNAQPDTLDRPRYLSNLAGSLRARYTHTNQLKDLEDAIRMYRQAVTVIPAGHPDLVSYLRNLGNGLHDRYTVTGHFEDLAEAIRIYEDALANLDRTLLVSTVVYQLGQQAQWARFYARAVAIHQQAGFLGQTLAIAEGYKSRLLSNLLGRGNLPIPSIVSTHLIVKEQKLAAELNDLDALDLASHRQFNTSQVENSRLAGLERRRQLVNQLSTLWSVIAGYGSEAADYVALRRGDRPDWPELQQLAGQLGPQVAVLSLFTLPDRVLLFVLKGGQEAPDVIEVALPEAELHYQYLANYEEEILNRRTHRVSGRPLTHRWRKLGQRLLTPLLPYLDGIVHLLVVPQGQFHSLPLHALILNNADETLLDRFAVSFIPALSLLARLRSRAPLETGTAFVLGYTPANPTTQVGAIERKIFLSEAIAVANQMNVQPCLDEQAHSEQLKTPLAGQTVSLVHLSCHGGFDQTDPLSSGVWLADGLFTARQWMELRFRADLVTLSACQTALTKSLGGDELAGLSQALLYAGASSLLLGLWSVNALTTQALMTDFYRRLWDDNGHKRSDEATALREATLALRDGQLLSPVDGFDPADPYYWAPFILIGDWR